MVSYCLSIGNLAVKMIMVKQQGIRKCQKLQNDEVPEPISLDIRTGIFLTLQRLTIHEEIEFHRILLILEFKQVRRALDSDWKTESLSVCLFGICHHISIFLGKHCIVINLWKQQWIK